MAPEATTADRATTTSAVVHAKFPARTVIADFLEAIAEGHPRVGRLHPHPDYSTLCAKADVLLALLKDNGIDLVERA